MQAILQDYISPDVISHIIVPMLEESKDQIKAKMKTVLHEMEEARIMKYILNQPKILGKVIIKVVFHLKGKRCLDLDNLLKLTIDSIKDKLIEDDRLVMKIDAEKFENMREDKIELTIFPIRCD